MEESVKYEDGKLKWRCEMPTEERRANNEKNWEDFRNFMLRSDTYRTADKIIQDAILLEAKKTNGRITALEDKQKEYEFKTKDTKDSKQNNRDLLMLIATIIMAVSSLVVIIKSVWK